MRHVPCAQRRRSDRDSRGVRVRSRRVFGDGRRGVVLRELDHERLLRAVIEREGCAVRFETRFGSLEGPLPRGVDVDGSRGIGDRPAFLSRDQGEDRPGRSHVEVRQPVQNLQRDDAEILRLVGGDVHEIALICVTFPAFDLDARWLPRFEIGDLLRKYPDLFAVDEQPGAVLFAGDFESGAASHRRERYVDEGRLSPH